jgi:hypothetical protein
MGSYGVQAFFSTPGASDENSILGRVDQAGRIRRRLLGWEMLAGRLVRQ